MNGSACGSFRILDNICIKRFSTNNNSRWTVSTRLLLTFKNVSDWKKQTLRIDQDWELKTNIQDWDERLERRKDRIVEKKAMVAELECMPDDYERELQLNYLEIQEGQCADQQYMVIKNRLRFERKSSENAKTEMATNEKDTKHKFRKPSRKSSKPKSFYRKNTNTEEVFRLQQKQAEEIDRLLPDFASAGSLCSTQRGSLKSDSTRNDPPKSAEAQYQEILASVKNERKKGIARLKAASGQNSTLEGSSNVSSTKSRAKA